MKVKCGDANPRGNIEFTYKGGCKKELDTTETYRCVGCGGWFHKECIIKHFELEKDHDYGRNELKKEIIKELRNLKRKSQETFDYQYREGMKILFNELIKIIKTK